MTKDNQRLTTVKTSIARIFFEVWGGGGGQRNNLQRRETVQGCASLGKFSPNPKIINRT